MARPIEQVLRDYLGEQVLTLAKLTAELEAAREELAALKAKAAEAGPKPNGRAPIEAPPLPSRA
jgi:hypothetical protein